MATGDPCCATQVSISKDISSFSPTMPSGIVITSTPYSRSQRSALATANGSALPLEPSTSANIRRSYGTMPRMCLQPCATNRDTEQQAWSKLIWLPGPLPANRLTRSRAFIKSDINLSGAPSSKPIVAPSPPLVNSFGWHLRRGMGLSMLSSEKLLSNALASIMPSK